MYKNSNFNSFTYYLEIKKGFQLKSAFQGQQAFAEKFIRNYAWLALWVNALTQ